MFENPHSDLFLFTCYEKNTFPFRYPSRNKRELSHNQIFGWDNDVLYVHQFQTLGFLQFWFFKLKSSSILSCWTNLSTITLIAPFYYPVGSDRKNRMEWSQSSETSFIIRPRTPCLSITTKIWYSCWKRLKASQELFYSRPLKYGRMFFF